MQRRTVWAAALLFALVTTVARAQTPYDDPKTPEGWAWTQIKAGKVADFNDHCGKVLDTYKLEGWDDPCRQISPQFVVNMLTVPQWRDQLGRNRMPLRGVRVNGNLDFGDTEITPEIWLEGSRIEGFLNFSDAHLRRLLSLDGSVVAGVFYALRMHADSSVTLSKHAGFLGEPNFYKAEIWGDLDMSASYFSSLSANMISVHNNLLLNAKSIFKGNVVLNGSIIDGELYADSSSFAKPFTATDLTVGRNFYMSDHASFASDVTLRSAKVGGNVEMGNASSFGGDVDLDNATIKGSVHVKQKSKIDGELSLLDATIGGDLELTDASFAKSVTLERVKVTGPTFIRLQSTFLGELNIRGGKIGWLFLSDDQLTGVDLAELVTTELSIFNLRWLCGDAKSAEGSKAAATQWPLGSPAWRHARCGQKDPAKSPTLILRNAHVEDFQDSADTWPFSVDLEGFHFDRLGGVGGLDGLGGDDMRDRLPDAWSDLLARDRIFSTQPYTQLAGVLLAAGHRNTADTILFAGRERERDDTWSHSETTFWHWLRRDFSNWVWLTFFGAVAGYGIGLYTFRVLWWVLALTVLGAAVLWYSPHARRRGIAWRCGASLHRLLPIVELHKDFKDFFDSTPSATGELRKLHRWQVVFFSVIALAGWVLGFFLLAAMGGLTPK